MCFSSSPDPPDLSPGYQPQDAWKSVKQTTAPDTKTGSPTPTTPSQPATPGTNTSPSGSKLPGMM